MSRWREFLYPFPDDFHSVLGVMNQPAVANRGDLHWKPFEGFLLSGLTAQSAVYLRMALGADLVALDGQSLLEESEMFVPADQRGECQRLLAENCASPAKWWPLILLFFQTDDAHRAFGAAYTSIIGLPNGAP